MQADGDQKKELSLRRDLNLVRQEIKRHNLVGHPGHYGMPDLLFPRGYSQGAFIGDESFLSLDYLGDGWERRSIGEETDEAYKIRQEDALREFVSERLRMTKGTGLREIVCFPEMMEFIVDVFTLRTRRAILWKPRGGSGSLSAGIVVFLLASYRRLSCLDLAGSEEQAKVVYEYTKNFWYCVPGLAQGLLASDPGVKETKLKTNVSIKCVPTTDKSVRGKHPPVLISDETCQASKTTLDPDDSVVRTAIQVVQSEPDSIVILLSTFHVPGGIFPEYWDNAEEKGYKRYKWSIFDCMQPCKRGFVSMSDAGVDTTKFCQDCFLTDKKYVIDENGHRTHVGYVGCNGKARNSKGWMTYETICDIKKENLGTEVFPIEYACERPNYAGVVYAGELIDEALCRPLQFDKEADKCMGIDWGSETENSMCMVLVVRMDQFIYVADAFMSDHMTTTEVQKEIERLWDRVGKFDILADRSHMFSNRDLAASGLPIKPVDFRKYKMPGIRNVSKYMTFRRLKINRQLDLFVKTLKKYHKRRDGSIVKRDDHSADALLCGCLKWKFEDLFGSDITDADKATYGKEEMPLVSVIGAPPQQKLFDPGARALREPQIPGQPIPVTVTTMAWNPPQPELPSSFAHGPGGRPLTPDEFVKARVFGWKSQS